MIKVFFVGLRELQGRFASMRDGGLTEIQLAEAERVAMVLEDIYRRHAPRSRGTAEGRQHFFQGLHARAEPRGFGFILQLTTEDPDLRKWLAEGTGLFGPRHARIYPKNARALGPIRSWAGGGGSGPFWFRSIAGMKPQHWEEVAALEAGPAMTIMGNRIANHVVHRLGSGV